MIHNNTRFGVQRNDVAPATFWCAAQCKLLQHATINNITYSGVEIQRTRIW